MLARISLCLTLALLQVSCASMPRNKQAAVPGANPGRLADSSEDTLLDVVAQTRPGTKLRFKLADHDEYGEGKFSQSNERYVFLESPADTLEIVHISELWKSSDAPSYAVMTGAIIGGIYGAMVFNQEGYSAFGVMVGVGLGMLLTFPASFAIPAWKQVFPRTTTRESSLAGAVVQTGSIGHDNVPATAGDGTV